MSIIHNDYIDDLNKVENLIHGISKRQQKYFVYLQMIIVVMIGSFLFVFIQNNSKSLESTFQEYSTTQIALINSRLDEIASHLFTIRLSIMSDYPTQFPSDILDPVNELVSGSYQIPKERNTDGIGNVIISESVIERDETKKLINAINGVLPEVEYLVDNNSLVDRFWFVPDLIDLYFIYPYIDVKDFLSVYPNFEDLEVPQYRRHLLNS